MDKKALIEAVKEISRISLIAIVSYLLTDGVLNTVVKFFFFEKLSPEMTVVLTGLTTAVLRSVEKYFYEAGSTNIVTETLRFEGRE